MTDKNKAEAVAWIIPGEHGVRMWTRDHAEAKRKAGDWDANAEPLFPASSLSSRDARIAELEGGREAIAAWMIANSYATGHGDTVEDLLRELDWQHAKKIAALSSAIRILSDTGRSDTARILDARDARIAELEAPCCECDAVSSAIGSVRWMDLPDGGSPTLAEQVSRMKADLAKAEALLEEAVKAMNIAEHDLTTTHNLRSTDLTVEQFNRSLTDEVPRNNLEWMTDTRIGPWRVWFDPPPIGTRNCDWHYQHDDAEPECPAWMHGHCASRDACIVEIIDTYEERLP